MAIVRVRMCRRLAITSDQGMGWSEYTGEQWVQPHVNGGAVLISDDNDVERLVFDCASPDNPGLYEASTYDQLTFSGPSFVDKHGVVPEDGGAAEIEWSKWCGEIVSDPRRQNDTLELNESHVFIRPQIAMNDGRTGYNSNGMRSGFTLNLSDYTEGDQRTPIGIATDVPVDGDVVFSGVKVEGRRHMIRITGSTSEVKVAGISHNFVSKPRPASVANRQTGDTNSQLSLSTGLQWWYSRGKALGYNRVDKQIYAPTFGVLSRATGVDGRQTAFTIPPGELQVGPVVPMGGEVTVYFVMCCADGTLDPHESTDVVQHGDAFNGWVVKTGKLRRNDSGGHATIRQGVYYDVRTFLTDRSGYAEEYYNNLRYSGGEGFLPIA